MSLAEFWFLVIAVLWLGFLFLEGFDFGVGMLLPVLPRDERERRVLINTIGPVWDGNEVWLITAIGATFAAFPQWYAGLLSALYLPMIGVLVALIVRGVAFEYRGLIDHPRWRGWWTAAIVTGSVVPILGIGYALAATMTGIPLDAAGDRIGSPLAVLSWPAVLGAVGFAGFSVIHGAAFLALKTAGAIRTRARAVVVRLAPVALIPLAAFGFWMQLTGGSPVSWACWGVGVAAAVLAWWCGRVSREGWSFALFGVFLAATLASAFGALFPNVLPSTVDSAWNLTVQNASSSPYTLTVMTWLAAFGLPVVLVYQTWTYWVFRRRISVQNIPSGEH